MVLLPFKLENGFTSQLQKGDLVKIGDIIASRKKINSKTIPLSEILNVKPHTAGKFLKVNPGETVSIGDVLAVRKGMFQENKIFSEITGIVMSYDRSSGFLSIHPSGVSKNRDEELKSPIDGTVLVCNNDQIVIETDKDVIIGEGGSGTNCEGIIYQPEKTNSDNTFLYTLDKEIEGKILLLVNSDRDILLKAIGMDVGGVISQNIQDSDFSYLEKRNISTPVIKVSENEWKKVLKWVGKKAYLDAAGKTVLLLHV